MHLPPRQADLSLEGAFEEGDRLLLKVKSSCGTEIGTAGLVLAKISIHSTDLEGKEVK